MPLCRKVRPHAPRAATTGWVIQFDASTTGGGAVLRNGTTITEYLVVKWDLRIVDGMDIELSNSKYQTFWEMFMLLVSLLVWGMYFVNEAVAVLGDNTGALQSALDLKGKGTLAAIARELAWRRERYGWIYEVGHVPSELNTIPDALSRQHEPRPLPFPALALKDARLRETQDLSKIWKCKVS